LLIEGKRVVDFTADAGGLKVGFEGVAAACAGDAEGVLIPDVAVVGIGDGKNEGWAALGLDI
jgi:hypothetical protein